ncbi:MAG: hypothetical protein ACYDAO_09760 [Thermoplasmataceae archaeon]
MNKKKGIKIIGVFLIIITIFSSFTYYENVTKPGGISTSYNSHCLQYIEKQNSGGSNIPFNVTGATYLGNHVNVGISSSFIYRQINTTWFLRQNTYNFIFLTDFFVINHTLSSPYDKLLVTVTNESISTNGTFLKWATDKNDNFGPRARIPFNWVQEEEKNVVNGLTLGLYLSSPDCPNYDYINNGNFTFYVNTTFTITAFYGPYHFTSSPYTIDLKWWQKWEYNCKFR